MFSRKFQQDADLNPLTLCLNTLKEKGIEIYDLTQSNPTQLGFNYPDNLLDALNKKQALQYEPTPQGLLAARKAISQYYQARGLNIKPDSLLLTASTSEAYAYLFKLLCDPGDEIIIPSPSYPLFDFIADLEQVHLIQNTLHYDSHWHTDFEALKDLINTRTKAIILVNPNNPTGHFLSEDEIKTYLEISKHHQIPLIIDEVFYDYSLEDKEHFSIQDPDALIFTLNGFSKTLALPQLKLGWIQVNGPDALALQAMEHLEIIADTFLSVNTPVQLACKELLSHQEMIQSQIIDRIHTNLEWAQTFVMDKSSITLLKPQAGWTLLLKLNELEDDEDFACSLLQAEQVHVHPGYLFGLEDGCFVAISLITPTPEFEEGLKRLAHHVEFKIG